MCTLVGGCFPVCPDVEVGEHEKEDRGVEAEDVRQDHGVTAWLEEPLDGMEETGDKLDQLQLRQIPLPLEVGTHLWSERRQQVVGVHDDVDEGVGEPAERHVSTGGQLEEQPRGQRHRRVMVHVESADVRVLLPQDEEQGVQPVHVLAQVVGVRGIDFPHSIPVSVDEALRVLLRLEPRHHPRLIEDPDVQEDQEDVVDHHRDLQVKGLPVLHERRSDPLDDEDVDEGEADAGHGISSQEPFFGHGFSRVYDPSMHGLQRLHRD